MGTLEEAESAIREVALRLVQTPDGRVRVEDYVATLAAATGEAALAASGFDVGGHTQPAGSALFFDPVNARLTGDPAVQPAPPGTVWSVLESLSGSLVPAGDFPVATALYTHVASTASQAPWGEVVTTVGSDHAPSRPPLRSAYDARPGVEAVERRFNADVGDRHFVTATALAAALRQTKDAIDPAVSLRLALEVVFGVAKLAPITSANASTAP